MKYRGVGYEAERDNKFLHVEEEAKIPPKPPAVTPNLRVYGKPKKPSKGLEL
jgi:hypothetical protein